MSEKRNNLSDRLIGSFEAKEHLERAIGHLEELAAMRRKRPPLDELLAALLATPSAAGEAARRQRCDVIELPRREAPEQPDAQSGAPVD